MQLEKILHVSANLEHDREVVQRLFDTNMDGKINAYLKKFEGKEDAQGRIELFVSANAHNQFDGKLVINLDGEAFRYEREDYHKLDDLVNHLFKHFKESLSGN